MLFENKDVAVIDLTHGGIPLARHIARQARSVTGIDIYGTVGGEILSGLEQDGIKTADKINTDIDLIVAPVHLNPALMPDSGKRTVITHHRAVGELISGILYGSLDGKVVEITGTLAKTSTATLLADMASRSMSVLSHTTRGVEHWQKGVPIKVHHGLSIAPGSILEALEHAADINPDLYIFEVSLGGTGAAELGIITSLDNEYTIAGGSSTSTRAKMQMVDYAKHGSTLLVNASVGQIDPPDDVKIITFSDTPGKGDVYMNDPHTGIRTINCESLDCGTIRFMPGPGYDPSSYSTAMVCAAAAACILDVEQGNIESALLDFQGVHGRMRQVEWAGRKMVDNSNSGMNINSVGHALEYAKNIAKTGNRLVLALGEEAKQVCEGLDPGDVSTFTIEHGSDVDDIILVGERMEGISGNNIHHADSLDRAIEMAESLTKENDIIISCVKCFR
ncbi:MAG: UDP-N-acetylmuramyl pentapeptide synthase [Candidatus Methanocomedens sp.]|nr:MAG: UDP-N-acetylmuramyl pentapeptide synthase [ANME-2 cluster archaeon]